MIKALSEATRVLKADGELHIADWDRPANGLMRSLFLLARLFDCFGNMADYARGGLPALVCAAGGCDVRLSKAYHTIFDSLVMFAATKSLQSICHHLTCRRLANVLSDYRPKKF